jgi:trk system potassium uptake protein TrkA
MIVIIIGAGKTGFSMAKLLVAEGHDVVVIEQMVDRQELINDALDVQTILGNGVSSAVLEAAGVRQADMLLALTQSDELNMVACLKAKRYGVKVSIARVSDTEYLQPQNSFLAETMEIDLMLNPQQVTAQYIAQIMKHPEALQVDYFADGRVQMLELLVEEDSIINGKKMRELQIAYPFNIVFITRQHKMVVPRGEDIVMAGDSIHLITQTADALMVEKSLGFNPRRIENVCILGGGRTGYYLAKILEKQQKPIASIKLIEKSRKPAENVSAKLDQTLVIHGDGSDYELLEGENIGSCDIFVAVTNDDQTNILCSLMAKTLGVPKGIAQVKKPELMPLAEQMGVDVALSPRILTAGAILRYIRRGEIISVTVLDESAEMLELVAQPGAKVLNKRLMDISFPKNSLIGAIVSGEQVIIPDGEVKVNVFDRVIIFCLADEIHRIEKLFMGTENFYD